MHRVNLARFLGLWTTVFLMCSCGTEPVGETESALTNTYTVGNLFSESQFSFQAAVGQPVNFLSYSATMPGLPWNPSNGGGFAFMDGAAYYDPSLPFGVGLNRIFAKCTRTGATYHCQWDLFWGDSAGHQYSAINAVYAIAFPGDTVYMTWYGRNQGSYSHTAYVSVYAPNGTLRVSNPRYDMDFATNLLPDAVSDPAFQFITDPAYSCTDLPAPDDDVSFNGQMGFTSWYGFAGQSPVMGYYALGSGSSMDSHCSLDWTRFADGSSTVYWHAH